MMGLTRMSDYARQSKRWGRGAVGLALGLSLGALGACEDLLDVKLPHLLTDAAIEGETTAQTQVNSAMALFECGYTAFGLMGMGAEDAMQSIAGVAGGMHVYDDTPDTGGCDGSSSSDSWFDQIMGTRSLISTSPDRLVASGTGAGRGVYDRIQDEWELGSAGERLSAIASIYMAASLAHMGEFLCEMSLDESDLITPTQMLSLAEGWITNNALGHIASYGDFEMPNGAATSATSMAMSIRARIRWASGNLSGAAADAATIPDGFTAWVTREAGATRRNKIYHSATEVGFSGMLGVNNWWNSAIRRPNPVTGQPWPDPIPFTGYIFLGIMDDGRTLEAGNLPVKWAEETRDGSDNPISLNNGAVADTRVLHHIQPIQGPVPEEVPDRYSANDNDVPYSSWEEMRLIEAGMAHSQGNFAGAIGFVNRLRDSHGLPRISGAYEATLLADGTAVRAMLMEERRREFFAEGARYWSTKIQNTDILWFPRRQGDTPFQGYALLGAVRQLFAGDEYILNPYFEALGGLDARGTGCTSLPGSQAPKFN